MNSHKFIVSLALALIGITSLLYCPQETFTPHETFRPMYEKALGANDVLWIQYWLSQDAIRAAGKGDLSRLQMHINPSNRLARFEIERENAFYWAMIVITAVKENKPEIINFLRNHSRFTSAKQKAIEHATSEADATLIDQLLAL